MDRKAEKQCMSNSVLVYGIDHSPWVQTVLIALEHQGVPYRIVHYPLSFSSYWKRGMVMPVCLWSDGTIITDSFAILAEIKRRSSGVIPSTEEDTDQARLELFFMLYVLTRFRWGNKMRFIHAWAQTAPSHPNSIVMSISHVFRATMSIYFLMLIQLGIWSQLRRKKSIYKSSRLQSEWTYWSDRLGDSLYFGGTKPNKIDYALLGQIQCITSGLSDITFSVLRSESNMMLWLERMHAIFPDYKRMYSKRVTTSSSCTQQSSMMGIFLFYISLFGHIIFAPLLLIFFLHAFTLRNKNPSRTMGKLFQEKNKYKPSSSKR